MIRRKRPGTGGSPAGSEESANEGNHLSADLARSLPVDTTAEDAEAALEAKVRAQLPDCPIGRILVVLNQAHRSVIKDAAALARFWGVSLAIVTMEGEVLAYRTPEDRD